MATNSLCAPQAAPTGDEPKPKSDGDDRPAARTWWAAALEWICAIGLDFDD